MAYGPQTYQLQYPTSLFRMENSEITVTNCCIIQFRRARPKNWGVTPESCHFNVEIYDELYPIPESLMCRKHMGKSPSIQRFIIIGPIK